MLREFTASIQKQNFTPEQSGDVYDPDTRLKKEAMKKRVEARIAEKKAAEELRIKNQEDINKAVRTPVSPDLQLKKIISGMQKNVDQYGIEAAKELGIDYGGTVNKGFKVVPEGSNSPNFQEFVDSGKWEEIESQDYRDRTKLNAQNADGTVWFGKTGTDSAGHNATKRYSGNKPWIENPTDKELRQWLIDNNIETLNVAGNRSYGTEELGQQAKETIVKAVQPDTPTSKNTLKIYYPYSNKNKTINHANSYKQIVEAQNPGLTVELVDNKSQADMIFGRGQGMGNPFSHESSHSEVIVKTRFFDETMIMYEAWLKGEPMPEGTTPITPEQQKRLDALKAEWDNKLKPFVSSSSFETVKRYSVEDLRNNPDKIYIFGDNTEGWGKGGQAIVRDEPNAFGISTKDSPTQFMSDNNFEANKAKIDADIAAIKADGRPIVFPEDGIGTGRADLQNKAPRTWAYLQKELNKLKGNNTKVKTFEVSTKGDAFGKQFSALNATFKEGEVAGRTVEDIWQNEIKKSGKGKPPAPDSVLYGRTLEESKLAYKELWKFWMDENPELALKLIKKINDENLQLTDSFAGPNTVSQAEALQEIAEEIIEELNARNMDLSTISYDKIDDSIKTSGGSVGAAKFTDDFFDPNAGKITSLPDNHIFVFGSNEAGRHGKGAALDAVNNFGAETGKGFGLQGQSFAIPTKDGNLNVLDNKQIQNYVNQFLEFAKQNPDKTFVFTDIGTGLAGKDSSEIASMLSNKTDNVIISKNFNNKLGGGSLGAAKLNDTNVFDTMIEEYTPGSKFLDDFKSSIPGYILVPFEQMIESGLKMSGYKEAAKIATKLVAWELYTFATSLGANVIGKGEGALTSPRLAQAYLLLGEEEKFKERAENIEKDMMENSAAVGQPLMSAIIKAMPSYWLDEWLLKRNPEFKGWKEMFPQVATLKKGADWGIGKLFGNGK